MSLTVRDKFPGQFPAIDFPDNIINTFSEYAASICSGLDMEDEADLLTGHILLLWQQDDEAPGVHDSPGEVMAEQYIQKRAEFRTLAEQGNHAWYTRTYLGSIFYTLLHTHHSVGIVDY